MKLKLMQTYDGIFLKTFLWLKSSLYLYLTISIFERLQRTFQGVNLFDDRWISSIRSIILLHIDCINPFSCSEKRKSFAFLWINIETIHDTVLSLVNTMKNKTKNVEFSVHKFNLNSFTEMPIKLPKMLLAME